MKSAPARRGIRSLVGAAVLAFLGRDASAQIPSRLGDPRPLGEIGRPVGIAGSSFEVWVAYPGALVQFPRLGRSAPRWFGSAEGLPAEGIASICYDDATQALWVGSVTGRNLRWSSGLQSAHDETPPPGGCRSRIARAISTSNMAPLLPSTPGWIQMGSDLSSPDGVRHHILLATVFDDRDLWLATDHGIWTGKASGRIEPVPFGLSEPCIVSTAVDSSGVAWLLGCTGSITAVDAAGRFLANLLPDDPRNSELRAAAFAGAAGSQGIWVSVLDGLVKLDPHGVQDRWTGRKAPFGGRVLSTLEIGDTLWCGTENSLVRRQIGEKSFKVDAPPWEATGPVRQLLSTPRGILAATDRGFWWKSPAGWTRPPFLARALESRVYLASLEAVPPHRIAWTDGREVFVDTLPGQGGRTARWRADPPIHSLAFDGYGNVELARDGSWILWNPITDERREWRAGLGLTGPVRRALPLGERVLLSGEGGASTVRIPAYAPPVASPR